MKFNLFLISFLFICQEIRCGWFFSQVIPKFVDYSKSLTNVKLDGYLAAFGDFNSDRNVDIFVLTDRDGKQYIDVILMAMKGADSRKPLFEIPGKDTRNVILGNFNGQSLMDIVTVNGPKRGPYSMYIRSGLSDRRGVNKPREVYNGLSFVKQPLHLDYNADMIGDFLGQLTNKEWVVLLGSTNGTFVKIQLGEAAQDVLKALDDVMYSQFVDINNDDQADIVFVAKKAGKVVIVSIIKINNEYKKGPYVDLGILSIVGQPVVADFLLSGRLQLLLPVCTEKTCGDSGLLLCEHKHVDSLKLDCQKTNMTRSGFSFVSPGDRGSLEAPPISQLVCGDTRLMGNTDCFTVMVDSATSSRRVVRLLNLGNAQFRIKELNADSGLQANVSQVGVFDLEEDGIPDLLLATEDGHIKPLLQQTAGDAYFIKVMVLTGLCGSPDSCPGSTLPYGLPLPGVKVSYRTESATSGGTQLAAASVAYDSSFASLQLPYVEFGLGAFANYVERLFVTLPRNNISRTYTHSFIVPKTQIVIIPYPLDNPSKWTNKLFLEPFLNQKVIYVAGALLGTMFVVAVILCLLQYLEVREDRLEKMQEAQKFHFDAM